VDSSGPKEAQVQSYSPGGANVLDDTTVICAKMAEPIDLSFGLWLVDSAHSGGPKAATAHWRHLANTLRLL